MADNYIQFSTRIDLHSEEEVTWFKTLLDQNVTKRPKWVTKLLKEICDEYESGDSFPGQYEIAGGDKKGVWFYSEEGSDPYPVALIMQAYLKKFHPKETLGFTWATTCSKMRLDEFGGGYAAVSAEKVTMQSADTVLTEVLEEMREAFK